mmetsp:Transcript_8379/g.13764  ORF Transcript_8379/g.13764 Transcript_8379/m.13764 type:complete len:328 (+) Transcript_8379:136-1119(+)
MQVIHYRSIHELMEIHFKQPRFIGNAGGLFVSIEMCGVDSCDLSASFLHFVKKCEYVRLRLCGQHIDLLGEHLQIGQQASLCVIPSVGRQFLRQWLQRFDDALNAKRIVCFAAIQSADHQVDNAQMVQLSTRSITIIICEHSGALFLALNAPHQLLRRFVLRGHNVGDAEIGEQHGRHAQNIISRARSCLLVHRLLIQRDAIRKAAAHKQDVRIVYLPHCVVLAKLARFLKEQHNLRIALVFPMQARRKHQDLDILFQAQQVFVDALLHSASISALLCLVQFLGQIPQILDMSIAQSRKLVHCLFIVWLILIAIMLFGGEDGVEQIV